MKTFRFLYCLMAVVLCVGVSSCSSNDDENGGDLGIKGKPVKSISYLITDTDNVESIEWNFAYINGKLVSGVSRCVWYNGSESPRNELVDYDKNTITSEKTYSFTLNDKKYVSSVGWSHAKYTYNSDGYLTQIKEEYDEHSIITTFEYTNGNPVLIKKEEKYSGQWYSSENLELAYNTDENRNGLLYPEYISNIVRLSGEEILHYAGLLGKPTKNLVKSAIRTYQSIHSTSPTKTMAFIYQSDNEGNVISCKYNGVTATYGY